MSSFSDLLPMYEGIDGSPVTTLQTQYSTNEDTATITVRDGTKLPDASNLITLYTSAGANSRIAVLKYGAKNENVLSDITVEYKNTTDEITFPVGTFVSRKYANADQHAFKNNIEVLSDVTRALVDYVQPTPSIYMFEIPDLPTVAALGSKFEGEHTLKHREVLNQFIDGKLSLYEQDECIASISPASYESTVTFTAGLEFTAAGTYAYTLKGKDLTGTEFSKQCTVTVINPLCIGHSSASTLTSEILSTFTFTSECYDGMTVTQTADNDYIWVCIAQPCTIEEITSYGFTVPIESAQVVKGMVGTTEVNFNCYRTTSKIIAGYENRLKLYMDFGD